MTIATEIQKLQTNLSNSYTACSDKGATIPANQNFDNLANCIASISSGGGGDTITATNTTGSAISNGDKVWIEPSGNNYNLINFRSAIYSNFTVVGSPSINIFTGVVSNFNYGSYLQLPRAFNPGNNPWEVRLKFTTSNSITGGLFQSLQTLNTDSGRYGIVLLTGDNKLDFAISADGNSWLFDSSTSFTLATNTTYWVKFGWTGTEYYLDYSMDGTNYTRDITYPSLTPAYSSSNYTILGMFSANMSYSFNGTLYLSDCTINESGSEWWNPRGIQITEDTLTGFAQENIAANASGSVKTVLGE